MDEGLDKRKLKSFIYMFTINFLLSWNKIIFYHIQWNPIVMDTN